MTRYLVFMYRWVLLRYASLLVVPLVLVACDGGPGTDPCEGITCSGHGTCALSNGEAICACDEGYTGDLCAECGDGFHDEGGECVVNEVCEADSCSGHGSCDDSTGVVSCTCDEGHEGSQCDECSFGYQDNDRDGGCLPDCATSGINCGNHGTCDDSGGAAVCVCDVGYNGAACDACDTGYQDNDGDGTCSADCAISGLDCGLHGTCDDSGGTAVCVCAEGYQDNDGDGSCLPSCGDCGGNGTCDDSGGAAICACDTGYAGPACDTCDTGYQDNDVDGTCLADCATSGLDCGANGACDDSGGTAICVCDEGYSGDQCAECAPGYHNEDGACVLDQECLENTCSGHGNCDDSTGVPICTCETGYTGDHCEACDTGYQDNDGDGTCLADCATSGLDCGLHGACDDSVGTAVCVCDEGYAGGTCDSCDTGYQDHDGNGTCLPDCATSGLDCGDHGTCDDSGGTAVCVCEAEYTGAECDTCAAGYQDNDGDGTCQANCATSGLNCGLHGTCDDMSGEAHCTCDDGWGGSDCSVEVVGIEWLAIPGGTFMMGSDSGSANEQPVHQVDVPGFEMTMTEVTVEQYQACVDAGVCTEPDDYTVSSYCNWGQAGREDHPVNCVDWFQAVDLCTWVGGRLPSEAEWEYAARGGGQDITYPWGDESPSCTYAVMYEGGYGCGMDRTWPVCSKTAGNTAQGLCDMAGNVWEWVQDWYHWDYNGAPSDGSAWESPSGSSRVVRGGGFDGDADCLRASYRHGGAPSDRFGLFGVRCAR